MAHETAYSSNIEYIQGDDEITKLHKNLYLELTKKVQNRYSVRYVSRAVRD